jgi:glycosyltransferase involved in cell wall biosynthesis
MTAINFYRSTDDALGYGRMGAGWDNALADLGIDIYADEAAGIYCDAVMWACPANHVRGWRSRQRRFVITMWEATHLPAGLHETIHEFEAVFVPSRQNLEIFSEVHDNVVLAHLGIDPVRFGYKDRRPFDGYFNVYAPGQGKRKGTDLAVAAFKAAFPKGHKFDPEPHLILKALRREEYDDERFEHVSGVISSGEEAALYDHAHCSLNLARGEGFGLFPIQAIAQGIPTVLTDAHGHAEYSHLGFPVAASLVPAQKFLYGDAGDWWEPHLDEAVDHLRDIYFNYDRATEFAWEASQVACKEFTWEKSAKIIADTIGESEVLDDPGEYVHTTRRLFTLRVDRYVDPFIGGEHYEFERGHEYQVPADVRRVIEDAGFLDRSCYDDQTGTLELAGADLGLKRR